MFKIKIYVLVFSLFLIVGTSASEAPRLPVTGVTTINYSGAPRAFLRAVSVADFRQKQAEVRAWNKSISSSAVQVYILPGDLASGESAESELKFKKFARDTGVESTRFFAPNGNIFIRFVAGVADCERLETLVKASLALVEISHTDGWDYYQARCALATDPVHVAADLQAQRAKIALAEIDVDGDPRC